MSFRDEFEKARDFLILHRADYGYAQSQFEWPQLEEFNWALDYFDPMATQNQAFALIILNEQGMEECVTFDELSLRSNQVANYLRGLGVQKGDSIFVLMQEERALWELMLGAMKIGAVIVPASPLLSRQELMDRLEHEKIRVLATDKKNSESFAISSSDVISILMDAINDEVLPEGWLRFHDYLNESTAFLYSDSDKTQRKDPLFRYFVSTPAVKPKMIEHSAVDYPVGNLTTMYWLGLHPGDIHLGLSSQGWSMYNWNSFIAPWNAEATIFILKQDRFDAKKVLDVLSSYRITSVCAPPTVWRLLMSEDLASYPVSVREATSTGEPLGAEVISAFVREWGVFIREGYVLSEAVAVVGVPPAEKESFGTMGKVLPGFKIFLKGAEEKDSGQGELCIELNENTRGLKMGVDRELGYYPTGDTAYVDYAGNFTFCQRVDGLFKSSDYRISPFELEYVLKDFPSIGEVIVIPSADPLRDFVPKALVSLVKGVEPTKKLALDIMNFSRSKLSPFKRIRRVEFMEIPKSTSGEVPREELIKIERRRREEGEKAPYEFWEEDSKIAINESWAQQLP